MIEDLLDQARVEDPSIECAFSEEATLEPVFVKNLEAVQGDEGDVILQPDKPGVYLAGIECDGTMYHSAAYARGRDKIRQSVLRGWVGPCLQSGRLTGGPTRTRPSMNCTRRCAVTLGCAVTI